MGRLWHAREILYSPSPSPSMRVSPSGNERLFVLPRHWNDLTHPACLGVHAHGS